MAEPTALERIHRLLMEGRLDEAEASLHAVKPAGVAEQRQHAHYLALVHFYRGDLQRAADEMSQAMKRFGDNVNLLRDYTVCLYHMKDLAAFRSGLARLEILLIELEKELKAHSLLECELMMGKFLEEEGRLVPAMIFYDRALSRAEDHEQRVKALTQKARWTALYEPSAELSALYRDLISVPAERISKDLQVELQHSLMLIELRLIGIDHAWQRVERLRGQLCELDARLMVFDFIEGVLGQDMDVGPAALEWMNEFNDLDAYETYLKQMVGRQLDHRAKILELNGLAAKLLLASYLRLLCLTANREPVASAKQELHRKIQLIIRGLDARSQELWNQRLKQALQSPEIKMDLDVRSRSVTVQGKSIDLSKKKIALQLLNGLLDRSSLSVEQAIELLWQSSFTPEHYHRLRMSTHRFNTLLHDATGLGKVIEVDSQTVRLRPEVRLKSVEDALNF